MELKVPQFNNESKDVNTPSPSTSQQQDIVINSPEDISKLCIVIKEQTKNQTPNKYTDTTRSLARTLHEAGVSYREIAATLNVKSIGTIHEWIHKANNAGSEGNNADTEPIKASLISKQYRNAAILSDEAMDADKIKAASTRDLMVSSGIAIQRGLELEGKSTSVFNISVTNNAVERSKDTIRDIDSEILDVDAEITRLRDKTGGGG